MQRRHPGARRSTGLAMTLETLPVIVAVVVPAVFNVVLPWLKKVQGAGQAGNAEPENAGGTDSHGGARAVGLASSGTGDREMAYRADQNLGAPSARRGATG